MKYKLKDFLTEYKELNTQSSYQPVAVGKYGIRNRNEIYKKDLSLDYSKNKVISLNSLIIGMGSNQIDIGILLEDQKYSVSPAYHTYRINTDIVDSKWLNYLFKVNNQFYFNKYSIHSVRQGKSVDLKTFFEEELNIPSFNIQHIICTKLKNIESVIDREQKNIDYYNILIKSRFIEMFGNTLDNEYGFKLDYLNNLGFLSRGKSKHRPRNDPKLLGGPYPLIQTGDVKQADIYITKYESTYSLFGLQQSKMWPKGTLCITIAANIAETAILNFDACFPDSIVGFIPNDSVNTIFMRFQIEALKDYLNSKATEVAQKNLNIDKLTKVLLMVPPLELQNEFASFVEQIDKLKFKAQERIKLYQELLNKKMEEYFD